MVRAYDAQQIEKRWQKRWIDEHTYEVDADDPRPASYVLCMYPYPSGPAHQGHVRNYTFGDLLVRHRTMKGQAVLSPFGFDSFGLPAENAAIKTGEHPRVFTEARIAELKEERDRAWCRIRLATTDRQPRSPVHAMEPGGVPSLPFYWPRLPGRGPSQLVPGCQTVLANEQVLADGTCERSGDIVVKRELEQWFYGITRYADELLDALDDLEWPDRGKAHAAQLDRALRRSRDRPRCGRPARRAFFEGLHDPA